MRLDSALAILESVRGKPQTVEERKRLAIDLTALILESAEREMTAEEHKLSEQMTRLMQDPVGKAFTTAMTDECFRSSSHKRVAEQMIYLLSQMGVPRYLDSWRRLELFAFKTMGPDLAQYLVPMATRALRKETERVILPGEAELLQKHLRARKREGVRQNLNHLGEAILGEKEAEKRLHTYLEDLKNPDINYMSVKISTIFSQISLVAFDETVDAIASRLRQLYRAAMKTRSNKFINLDMEEYRDLDLTVSAFQKVLNDPEFHSYSAGIVLQAYLPDSYEVQKKLTEWAKLRLKEGGAPIKIRIVKGANLAMEQFEASLKGWPQAPYNQKIDVDANYKRMLQFGCIPENARAVRLGIASHNVFDISYAMLLRLENQVEGYTGFEMLEGMADHIRRVVQKLSGDMLLYCPVATEKEFQHAIAYLIRRLDENTGPENFLRHVFGLKPGTEAWEQQTTLFSESCDQIERASAQPRRTQDRRLRPSLPDPRLGFENEPDTDFSLPQNRRWAEEIVMSSSGTPDSNVKRLYIGGHLRKDQLDKAIKTAKAAEKEWAETSVEHRSLLLAKIAQILRERRGELIGIMMTDAKKTILEADPEVSEAIDFAEYYRRQIEKLTSVQDIEWTPKGTVLVTPPWNFPCAIPAGGVLAALAAGNCVLLKPASATVQVAWSLVNAFWDAGIPKEVLQFIPCSGEEVGSILITDERIDAVILTGGTETARKFLKMRPEIDLSAETGGKNAMIVTAMADRDLAVKDIIQSAFGHQGQKCSATSLAILEAEVYDDPHFMNALRDAAASLKLGEATDLATKIAPLIQAPKGVLLKGLTTLEEGEIWLLEPKEHAENLWSPGIKIGVKPGSFMHMTELFGPVLSVMRANDLPHAIELANMVPYGLTSGLQSLDEREQEFWLEHIEAGNLYINRGTTGAIVRRQPFGGCKASSFGGGSKAGGPNYLREFMQARQVGLPQDKSPVNDAVNSMTFLLDQVKLSAEELGLWTAAVANYAYWWKRLKLDRDPTKIIGQDNIFHYVPRKKLTFRIGSKSASLDILRVVAAALTVEADVTLSYSSARRLEFDIAALKKIIPVVDETEGEFIARFPTIERIRMVEKPSKALYTAAADAGIHIMTAPVLANGRFELLHYLREVSISHDYHRYGNLGRREGELRKILL